MKVNSELSNKEIEEALIKSQSAGIKESLRILWGLFKDFEGDTEFERLRWKIKVEGFILRFDIRNVIYGQVEEYPDSNKVRIRGCKKINIHKYWDELEYRERAIKDIIREEYDEGIQGEHKDSKYDK